MVGENFQPGKRFPSQLIASAFNERQLERLYENTGLMTYTTDLEILNEKVFNWVCEGKANHVGYQEWKRRLYAAVDIFGRGNVNSGIVLGCELAQPYGFQSEDEAHRAVVETAQELAEHGVGLGANVWRSISHSVFQYQNTPSLDYYARTFLAFDKLHHQYELGRFIDDYRRCGMHPGNDLVRI
jgi:biotin synthase-related radical SAM superfamily protein